MTAVYYDNLENRIPFWNRRARRTQRVHKYRARLVGVPRLLSDSLRSSRPSRSYVQRFLPPCVRFRPGRRYHPRTQRARPTGRQLGKLNSILEQKDAKDAKSAQYLARSVGVSHLASAFLRSSRPSRSYVQGFLPPCVRFRPGRRYRPRAHRARSTGRQLGKPNSILEQKGAKDAKSAQIPSPIGWRPSPPLGFSPIFAPFAILCSRFSPPVFEVSPHDSQARARFGQRPGPRVHSTAGRACLPPACRSVRAALSSLC